MYPRIKEISGKQYVYLVEGVRSGAYTRQKTLAYLGPLATLTFGIPLSVRIGVQRKLKRDIDWALITRKITKLPVRYDEFASKRRGLSARIKDRKMPRRVKLEKSDPSKLLQERELGELYALARLSKLSFESRFEKVGPFAYRLRTQR